MAKSGKIIKIEFDDKDIIDNVTRFPEPETTYEEGNKYLPSVEIEFEWRDDGTIYKRLVSLLWNIRNWFRLN